jgi:hypothetical protein
VPIIWIDKRPVVLGSGVGSRTGGGGSSLSTHRHTSEQDGGVLFDYLNPASHADMGLHRLGLDVPHDVHARLSGLDADDHKQYLLADGTRPLGGSLILANERGVIQSRDYQSGVRGFSINYDGSAEFNRVHIRGEITSTVLAYQQIHASSGSLGIFKKAGVIKSAVTTVSEPASTYLDIDDPSDGHRPVFAAGDLLWIKNGLDSAYMTVNPNGVTDMGTHYRFDCLCNIGGGKTFPEGTAVVFRGNVDTFSNLSDNAWILLSADHDNAPFLSVRTSQGWNPNQDIELVRLGNLNGVGGNTSDVYGLWAGNPVNNDCISFDTDNGLKIKAGGGLVSLDSNGLMLDSGSSYSAESSIKWRVGSTQFGDLYGYQLPDGSYSMLRTLDGRAAFLQQQAAAGFSKVLIQATDGNYLPTYYGSISVQTDLNLTTSRVKLLGTNIELDGSVKKLDPTNGDHLIDGKHGWNYCIDNGAVVIPVSAGVPFRVPYKCKLLTMDVNADVVTNATVQVQTCNWSNYGTWSLLGQVTLSGVNRNSATWNATVNAGDFLRVNITSNSAAKQINVHAPLIKVP